MSAEDALIPKQAGHHLLVTSWNRERPPSNLPGEGIQGGQQARMASIADNLGGQHLNSSAEGLQNDGQDLVQVACNQDEGREHQQDQEDGEILVKSEGGKD